MVQVHVPVKGVEVRLLSGAPAFVWSIAAFISLRRAMAIGGGPPPLHYNAPRLRFGMPVGVNMVNTIKWGSTYFQEHIALTLSL